jgi:hypothetical protein
LQFTENGTTVSVAAPRKVRLGDDEMSLTAATRKLLDLNYDVAPIPYWSFNDRSLQEIYDQTYPF